MKRFISTLIALLVSFQLLGISSGAEVLTGGSEDGAVSTEVIEVESVYIDNATVTLEDGNTIVNYAIVNNTSSDISATAIVCLYSETGSLLTSAYYQEELLAANSTSQLCTTQSVTCSVIKIFLVNTGDFTPLCNSLIITTEEPSDGGNSVYMSDFSGNFDDGLEDINLTFYTESNKVGFSTPYSGAETTLIMLTTSGDTIAADNVFYIDQTSELGGFTGILCLGENLAEEEYTLSFFGSDGSVMSTSFEYYSRTEKDLALEAINNASHYIEIRDVLEQYKDVLGICEEYAALNDDGKTYVCKQLLGYAFTDVAELQDKVYYTVKEYNSSQAVSPSYPSYGGGGGGSSIEGDNVVQVATVKGNAGETVCVDVLLHNNTGITSMGIEIDYDDSIMTLTDVQTYDGVGATVTPAIDFSVKPYHILFDSTQNFTYSGSLATLTFEIAADAPTGEYPITIDYYKGPDGDYVDGDDINYDENLAPVALTYASGSLKIYTPGDLNDDKKINNKDATYLLRYLADWDIPDIVTVALDVNGDDCVDENDATHLLRYIAKWSNIVLY